MDHLSLPELLHKMHKQVQKTDDDRYSEAVFVLMDAVRCGATSLYSVASNPRPVLKAYKDLGLKGAVSCFFNDQWQGHGDAPKQTDYDRIGEHFEALFAEQTERIKVHIGAASIGSASDALLCCVDRLARQFQTKVNMHISEGLAQVNTCLASRGKTPVRVLFDLDILGSHWNLIHATSVDSKEMDLIQEAGASVILCPVSNAKTGVGMPPILELMKRDIPLCLGTDACSNNNTNNILNEAYFASLLQTAHHCDPQALPPSILFQWLSETGLKMMGLTQTGKIAVGEPADLLLWSLGQGAFVPLAYKNFDSALIYNAPDLKPHTVIIDGVKVVENYRFIPREEAAIIGMANKNSAKFAWKLKSTETYPINNNASH
ncbi:MAG: hypothetical protein A2Y14_04190 [Verrucomicrobia bacterium GWF2_51_19]|nr:MAG: hypothetical protein A2Y14_04190 [Verrucomicrobia bacterium GWF2_51_19]